MNTFKAVAFFLALCLATPAFSSQVPTADQVFEHYISAMGGADHLGRIQTRSYEAKISSGFLSYHLQSRFERPNHFEEKISLLGMGSTNGYDGEKGWIKKGGDLAVVSGDLLLRAIRSHSLDWYTQYKTWYPSRRLLPDSVIAGTPVHVLETVASNGDREVWSFDTKTGLLLQIEGVTHDDPAHPLPIVMTFSDYSLFDGVLLACTVSMQSGDKNLVIKINSVKQNIPVDPIRFPAESTK